MVQRFARLARALGLLVGMALLAGCAAPAPSGASAPAASKPASTAPAQATSAPGQAGSPAGQRATPSEWAAIVEAAKREGAVTCGCPGRPDYTQRIKDAFESANPGIRLDASPATPPEFWVRVDKEQDAGQYLWDVHTWGPAAEMYVLRDKGGLESVRDYMVGPDVGGDADWEGGLAGPFVDDDKKYLFGYLIGVTSLVHVNRDAAPDEKITSLQDLLKPAFKGRLVIQDPRYAGSSINYVAAAYMKYGRDGLKQLLVDQEPVIVRGIQEVGDQLVRGGKAVSIPRLSPDVMGQFQAAGVRMNIDSAVLSDIATVSHAGSTLTIFKNPPHPNATKVFVNWVLSKEGQTTIGTIAGFDSLRKDVPPMGPADQHRQSGVTYIDTHQENFMLGKMREAQQVANELLSR